MTGQRILVIDDSPTILKVVHLVLTKNGFSVETAADGQSGLEVAQDDPPDLILLDFVMPRLNGYQFCREASHIESLRNVPIVLMSAKGDQVGERFVKVMGIVDYITKPFSPDAITGVVQHTLAKYARPQESYPAPLILGADDVTEIREVDDSLQSDRKAAQREALDQIAKSLATKIAGHLSLAQAAVEDEGGAPLVIDGTAITQATRIALDDEGVRSLLAEAVEADEPALRGDLHTVPLADVLELLASQEQTGTLAVTRARGAVDVHFRRGRVDLALAAGVDEEFLLGRFIVESDAMSREDFDEFLRTRKGQGRLLGDDLVRLGYINDADLKSQLRRQSCELLYECLRWSFGNFRFLRSMTLPPSAIEASLGIDVQGILMEGFRRVDEWHLIEREVGNFDLVFLRNEDSLARLGRGQLTRDELAILELVNGKNTVKDIIRQSRLGSFDVSKMLYRLLSIKLLRRRVMPVAV